LKSPAELYIRYLIATKCTDNRINTLLENIGFPRVRSTDMLRLRRRHRPPRVFRLGVKHKASDRWLEKMTIYPLVYRDEHMDEATMLLANNSLRPLLEALLLADVGLKETLRLVKKRTGRKLSDQTVRYYKHFFWNRDLLTQKQWQEFLPEYSRGEALKGVYEEGPDMVKWRLGFNKKIDANDMLRAIQGEAFHRFMQTHTLPNDTRTAKVAATWAGIVVESERQLNSGETLLTDVISRFEEIVMRQSSEVILPLDALAGNRHSGRQLSSNKASEVVVLDAEVTKDPAE